MNKKEITLVREQHSSCSNQPRRYILGRPKNERWNVSSHVRILSSYQWSLRLCLDTVSSSLANGGQQFFVSRHTCLFASSDFIGLLRLASVDAFKAWLYSISWTRESIVKWQRFFSSSSRLTYIIGGSHFDSVATDIMPIDQDLPSKECIKEQSQISSSIATITNSAINHRMRPFFLCTIFLLLVLEVRSFSDE